MKKLNLFGFAIAILLVSFSSVKSQSVDDVIKKYLDAVGGVEAWKKVENMKQSGSLTMVTQGGLNIKFNTMAARPNMTRQEGEFQGMKFIESFDGTTAWTVNPFAGQKDPTKKSKDETDEASKEAFEDEFIDYAAKGHQVELMGTEEIDGTKAFKVKLTRKSADERIYFFDATSYLPIMLRTVAQSGAAKGAITETYMSDYKKVGDVMIPHSIEQKMKGETQIIIKADVIELNTKMAPKETFGFPSN